MPESNPSRPELVKGEIVQRGGPVTKERARALTDHIRCAAEELGALLLEAYENRIWKALGYTSMETWANQEFGKSRSSIFRHINAERLARALEAGPVTRSKTQPTLAHVSLGATGVTVTPNVTSDNQGVTGVTDLKSHLNALLTCSPDDVTTFIAATSKRASCERAAKRLRQYAAQFDLRARSLPDD